MITNVFFFGGCLDGGIIQAADAVQKFILPHPRDRNHQAIYEESAAWSAHFERRTAVPQGFAMKPAHSTAAA